MTICGARPDGGFGPYYPNPHVLTTCFEDTILIPLGCWLFLLIAVIHLIARIRMRRYAEKNDIPPYTSYDPENRLFPLGLNWRRHHLQKSHTVAVAVTGTAEPRKRRITRLILLILCTFLLIALIAMHALEIARLAASNYGIGLLPFCFVPLLVVLYSLYRPTPAWDRRGERERGQKARPHGCWWMLFVGIWAVWMAVMYGVKLGSLAGVFDKVGQGVYDKGSLYKYADRVTDSVVILCVYLVFYICYVVEIHLEYQRQGWELFG